MLLTRAGYLSEAMLTVWYWPVGIKSRRCASGVGNLADLVGQVDGGGLDSGLPRGRQVTGSARLRIVTQRRCCA